MPIEITTRLGDTLLDVTVVERDFTLGDVPLVYGGQLVGDTVGRVGLVDYTANVVTKPARSVPFTRDTDRTWLPYVAAALVVHVGLWGVAAIMRPPVERQVAAKPTRPKVTRIVAEASKAVAPPDDRARDKVDDTKANGQGKAAMGTSGKLGAKSPSERGHVAIKNTGEEAQLTKAEQIARARIAGILGSAQTVLDNYATLGGSDRLTSAFDAISTNGSTGDAGSSGGSFGLGYSGGGGGGGSMSYGTIGTGRYGTISSGTTGGHGWGGSRMPDIQPIRWNDSGRYYDGGYYSGRVSARLPRVTICPTGFEPCVVDGALDKSIVRRYVKRNIAKLEYCFEKEILAKPEIMKGGVMTLSFTVSAEEGRVDVERFNGFDSTVAMCVTRVLMQIEMPKGGAVVDYTLYFRGPD